MTTRFLVLSPDFPDTFLPFWQKLWESGVQVLGLSQTPWDDLPELLREHLHAYWKVEDMHDLAELEHAVSELSQTHGELHYIESLNEYWLETEAHLRSHLCLLGPNRESIHRLKHKSHMQGVYQQAGIPVPPGVLLQDEASGTNFLATHGYPAVAKPDVGVGAAQTYKIEGPESYRDFWLHKPDVPYFLQGFIGGELYSFDGLVDHRGQLRFCAAHRFNHGIMDVVNQHLDLQYYSLRDIPERLYELGLQTIQAFDLHSRFFHFEFFRTAEDWVALEVNMRPPGGWTVDMFNYANDISVFEAYAAVILQKQQSPSYHRPYHVGYAGRRQRPYRHDKTALTRHLGDRLLKQDTVAGIFAPVLGEEGYLVRHADLDQVQQDLNWIQELS